MDPARSISQPRLGRGGPFNLAFSPFHKYWSPWYSARFFRLPRGDGVPLILEGFLLLDGRMIQSSFIRFIWFHIITCFPATLDCVSGSEGGNEKRVSECGLHETRVDDCVRTPCQGRHDFLTHLGASESVPIVKKCLREGVGICIHKAAA